MLRLCENKVMAMNNDHALLSEATHYEKAIIYSFNHGDRVTFESLIDTINKDSKIYNELSKFVVTHESEYLYWIDSNRKNRTELLISKFGFDAILSITSDPSVITRFISRRERLKAFNGLYSYVENNRYCSLDIVNGRVNLLKAAKGTGKTATFKRYITDNCSNKSVLVITHRRSLNKELAKKLSFSYYEDLKEISIEALRACNRLTVSPESLKYVDTVAFDVVIIDEVEQVLRHITHSDTMNGDGLMAYSMIARFFIPQAQTVILSDADLGACCDRLLNDAEITDAITLTNEYLPRKEAGDTIYLMQSKDDTYSKWKVDNRRSYGCSNEKRYAETFNSLKDNCLLITSDTSKDIDHLVVKINDEIHKYSGICASPSMATGVSIDAGHGIGATYSIFGSTTTTVNDCFQQIARVRDCSEHYCYVQPSSSNLPTTTEEVLRLLIKEPYKLTGAQVGHNGKLIIDGYTKMWATVQAEINKSRNDMRGEFIKAAKAEGFTVVIIEKSDSDHEELIEAKESAKETREKIKAAKIEAKAEELKPALGDYAQQVAELDVKKHLLSTGVKRIRMARMDKAQAHRQDKKERNQNSNHEISALDLNNHSLKRKTALAVYKSAGFNVNTFEITPKSWTSDSQFITTLAKKYGRELYSQFGITSTAKNLENPARWYNGVLAKFGLFVVGKNKEKGGLTGTRYSLPKNNSDILQLIVSKGV